MLNGELILGIVRNVVVVVNNRHDPSTCRQILRDFRRTGLTRELLDRAVALNTGVYRAEALCGLCASDEMSDEERSEWVPLIIEAIQDEERDWRIGECIVSICRLLSKWPDENANRKLIHNLISITEKLESSEAKTDAVKSMCGKAPNQALLELLKIAIDSEEIEIKTARPVIKSIVEKKNVPIIEKSIALATETHPDIAVRLLATIHHALHESEIQISPTAMECMLPLLKQADADTIRTVCVQATSTKDVQDLYLTLQGTNQNSLRWIVTLAGKADQVGNPELSRKLLEYVCLHVDNLDERSANKIRKNVSKAYRRLGEDALASELYSPEIILASEGELAITGIETKGHTIALVDTYSGKIGIPHIRVLARAAGAAWGFGLDIALVDWPVDNLDVLCESALKESRMEGVNHLSDLKNSSRIRLTTTEDILSGKCGHPVATTHKPRGGSVNLESLEGSICMLIGLGHQGLPKRILDNCDDQFELTGVGASLETAIAMGAIAQRLNAL